MSWALISDFSCRPAAVFREIAATIPAYAELRYPLLKDESQPVQVKHTQASQRDLSAEWSNYDKLVSELAAATVASKQLRRTLVMSCLRPAR